jgi:hypothetical protein
MKSLTKIILTIGLLFVTIPTMGQYDRPTYHDSYNDFYIFGGYQQLQHPTGTYHVASIHAEILYSFFGSRIGVTMGSDYFSFSPCGIFLFAPGIFIETMRGEGGNPALLPFMLISLSAAQWHIPLSDHIEVSCGWDAMKFTKLKNYSDTYYITGSLNAGLTCFLGNNLFINGYYEFNHTNNYMISFINWMFESQVFSNQPSVLKGHSFGARIGWMF